MPAKAPIVVGSRVRFSSKWLRSTCSFTGQLGQLKGTVTAIRKLSKSGPDYARILWDYLYFEEAETTALASNLEVLRG